jgi:hypothetical protein
MEEKVFMFQRVDAQPHTGRQFRNNACDGFQDDIQRLYCIMREHFCLMSNFSDMEAHYQTASC